MGLRYDFFYRMKEGKINILYVFSGNEGERKTGIMHSYEKLIDFIKHHCIYSCDVYFNDFEIDRILYILNGICDDIEYYCPPIMEEGPYVMYKKMKKRGK